jgi:hypothetical protein
MDVSGSTSTRDWIISRPGTERSWRCRLVRHSPRRELDRRAWDVAVLFGGAHLGLPEERVRNDDTIPAAPRRQGHPWRLTLACMLCGKIA